MEIKNLIYLMVGSVIAVLMIGSLLIPFVADYTDSTKEYYNNDFGPFAEVPNGDVVNIHATTTVGTAGSTVLEVDDFVLNLAHGPRSIMLANSFILFQNYSNGLQLAGIINEDGTVYRGDHKEVTLSISNNVATITAVTSEDVTKTFVVPFEWGYYRNDVGGFRMVEYISDDRTVHVNSIDQVRGCNIIGKTGQFFTFEGDNVTVFNADGTSFPTTANISTTDVMNNVKSFTVSSDRTNSNAFHFTVDDNGSPYDVYPYYFIVPYKVYGITEQNTVINSIFSIIPIIFVAGVVVTVVYWAIGRK